MSQHSGEIQAKKIQFQTKTPSLPSAEEDCEMRLKALEKKQVDLELI